MLRALALDGGVKVEASISIGSVVELLTTMGSKCRLGCMSASECVVIVLFLLLWTRA